MNNKLYSIVLLLASMVVISSGAKLGLPHNYTWPLKSKNICFAATFDLKLNVEYLKADGTNGSASISLDNSTFESFSVACSNPDNVHQLTISMLNLFTSIIFNFSVDAQNSTSLKKVYGYLYVDNNQTFPDYAASTAGVHKFSTGEETLFTSDRGNSYRCNTQTEIKDFQSNGTLSIKSLDLQNLHLQPFLDDSKPFTAYDSEVVCKADVDKDSNLIPIIVGACLAVMIVVVLAAYLIGRRRNRNGYQSV